MCFFLFVVVVVVFFYSDSQCWFKTSKSVHKKQGRKCIFHSGVLLGLSGIIGRPQAKAWREMFQHFQKRFNICWVGFFIFFFFFFFNDGLRRGGKKKASTGRFFFLRRNAATSLHQNVKSEPRQITKKKKKVPFC